MRLAGVLCEAILSVHLDHIPLFSTCGVWNLLENIFLGGSGNMLAKASMQHERGVFTERVHLVGLCDHRAGCWFYISFRHDCGVSRKQLMPSEGWWCWCSYTTGAILLGVRGSF
jgi:hypothetical protein